MGERTRWTPDVANTKDVMIKSDVGMAKEGELGVFFMSGSCRSRVLIQFLARSWHYQLRHDDDLIMAPNKGTHPDSTADCHHRSS
jgi:hypothetical protein